MSIEEGRRRRDRGIKQVLNASTDKAKTAIIDAILAAASRYSELTMDDIHECLGSDEEFRPNAIGGLMRRASVKGVLVDTGRVTPSNRATRRGGKNTIWRSTIYRPAAA